MTGSLGANIDMPAGPRHSHWRTVRLSAAMVILVSFAIAAIWIYRECTVVRTVDINGLAATESTCAPPDVSSATVLVLLLIVIALLWPDISEIAVLGVTIKRRIAVAESKAATAREGVEDLRSTILLQQVQIDAVASTNSTASATVHNHFGSDGWGENERRRLQDETFKVAGDPNLLAEERLDDRSRIDANVAELKIKLLDRYETLATVLDLNSLRGRGRPTLEEAHKRRVREWFVADYAPALDSVRQLRNAIAHSRDVSKDDVIKGLMVLDQLIPNALAWIETHEADS